MSDKTVTSKRWLTVWITNGKTSSFWVETTILELVPHMQNLTCITSSDDGACHITPWTLASGPTFRTSDDGVREGWSSNLSSVSMKLNIKTEYVSQADFSFHAATHSKEAPLCQISEPWRRKKIVIIVWKRLAKCFPFQHLIYLRNWVPCLHCRQNDLQWQNEDSEHLASVVRHYRDLLKCRMVPLFSQNPFILGNRAVATSENTLRTTYDVSPSLLVLFQ